MFWLFLWVLAFFLVAAGTFISAIVSCLVKGKWQRTCVDVLLVFATLSVAVGFSAALLPKEIIEKESTKLPPAARIHQADFSASGLIGLGYTEQYDGPLKFIVMLDGQTSIKKATATVLESVKSLANSYPNDDQLAARLAILTKSSGESPEPIFERYTRSGGKPSILLSSLRALYMTPESLKADIYITAIKAGLPSGWYRQTALAEAYRISNSPELKAEIAESEKKSIEWRTKFAAYQIFKLLFALAGAYVIFATIKTHRSRGEFEPLAIDFRRMYAIILSALYAQISFGIIAGICLGVTSVLTHTDSNLAGSKSSIELISVASGIIAALLAFYFLICRPNKLSIRQAFMRGNQVANLPQFAKLAVAGFVAMVSLNMFIRMVRNLLPEAPTSVSNTAQLSMIDSFVSLDYIAISWSVLFILILAPFSEELMFRGLVYGWLRHRFGVMIGVIGSALLFAGYHFDLVGFWQYFGIGLVLAIAYERSRSLLVTTAIHGLWNGWIILATALLVNR
ncbi:MAG: type II CAAX endopeptidase family protein [Candidatus Obscuribacterales bacterium]